MVSPLFSFTSKFFSHRDDLFSHRPYTVNIRIIFAFPADGLSSVRVNLAAKQGPTKSRPAGRTPPGAVRTPA